MRWWDGWQEDGTHFSLPNYDKYDVHATQMQETSASSSIRCRKPRLDVDCRSTLPKPPSRKNPVKSRRHAKHDVSIASPSSWPPPTPPSLAFFSHHFISARFRPRSSSFLLQCGRTQGALRKRHKNRRQRTPLVPSKRSRPGSFPQARRTKPWFLSTSGASCNMSKCPFSPLLVCLSRPTTVIISIGSRLRDVDN